ncbi:hypothetical protein RclHR1_00810019 [Rhizophagus clarus]|uniref:F-box domain-containing protein n=1 Tax=Rhizophagus clarus TaxID=94130 RepID=A0A2Z6SMJ3_9GLOM|nr:hypothetical protein RclHR1_00810019 [Rhizophagus clarus]GES95283.1 hypothetical protein GLOIN_2v1875106 [Rhizophagus clarus]
MASYLLSECLEIIFLNLTEYPSSYITINVSTKDLHSCTLVSRHWCKISTPFLYAYPFHHFRSKFSQTQYYKLIRTLLGCIPQFEIKQTKRTYKQDVQSDSLSTFNYISFIRGLIFHEMIFKPEMICDYSNKEIWLAEYNPEEISNNSTISIMNHLIKFICKHCDNLSILEFSSGMKNDNNLIKLLTSNDSNGKNKLNKLKELYYYNVDYRSVDNLYLTSLDNVCNLKLFYLFNGKINTIEKTHSLSQFISSQKNLQHVILSAGGEQIDDLDQNIGNIGAVRIFMNLLSKAGKPYYVNNFINSLSTQSESLQVLEFRCLATKLIDNEVLNSLNSLKNIRELKFYKCENIDDFYLWIKGLKKLEAFEITMGHSKISEINLIQLTQSFPSQLNKLIIIDDYSKSNFTQLFQQIPLYLHSLTHLVLPKIFLSELLSILKSCTELIYLGVILANELQEENLINLGESVPKTLRRIKFKRIQSIISMELLNYFLEAYAINGGTLKYLELDYCNNYNGNYSKVNEQHGIQIIEYYDSVI